METIAVIVPVYNAANTIVRCITSLLNQHRENEAFEYQVIAIDDGSNDSTSAVLDELAKDNARLIVFHEENGGPAAARKYGIDNSNSDYLAFCDADDYVDSDWLFTMYKYLKQYNADISRIMAYINDNPIDIVYKEPYQVNIWNQYETIEQFIEHKNINGILWNSLYKRELFNDIEWNFDMRVFEDAYLVWQILLKTDKYIRIRVPKYHYMYCATSLINVPYNLNRFQSTNLLLKKIISDCKNMNCHLSSARKMSYQWKFSNYLSFSNSGNMPIRVKKEMRETLYNDFFNYFNTIQGLKNKISLIALLISPNITARIYKLMH